MCLVGAIFAQIQSQIDAADNLYNQKTSLIGPVVRVKLWNVVKSSTLARNIVIIRFLGETGKRIIETEQDMELF